jgi:DNA replicative helicase MCM subunit Mcm2 (Cdc46/Mcm family)
VERIKLLHDTYTATTTIEVLGQTTEINKEVYAELTSDAWEAYGDMEEKMVEAAVGSEKSMVALPTFERLSRSLLKLSTLLAAARRDPQDKLIVEKREIDEAAYYIQRWGRFSIDLIVNAAKGTTERRLEKVLRTIEKFPDSTRSKVMQAHNMTKRDADEILGTLIDRGQIVQTRSGRGVRLRAI